MNSAYLHCPYMDIKGNATGCGVILDDTSLTLGEFIVK